MNLRASGVAVVALLAALGACSGSTAGRQQDPAAAPTAKAKVREATLRAADGAKLGIARLKITDDATFSLAATGLSEPTGRHRIWLLWLMRNEKRGYPVGYGLPGLAHGTLCVTDGKISRAREFASKIAAEANFLTLAVHKYQGIGPAILASRFGRAEHPRRISGRQVASGPLHGRSPGGIRSHCRD